MIPRSIGQSKTHSDPYKKDWIVIQIRGALEHAPPTWSINYTLRLRREPRNLTTIRMLQLVTDGCDKPRDK